MSQSVIMNERNAAFKHSTSKRNRSNKIELRNRTRYRIQSKITRYPAIKALKGSNSFDILIRDWVVSTHLIDAADKSIEDEAVKNHLSAAS